MVGVYLQMMMKVNKNSLLISTYVISMIPKLFYGSTERLNLGLIVERSTRIDFFFMYYGIHINFLILAYCLHFLNRIDKRVSKFILIISILDLLHLSLLSMQGFELAKIGIAVTLLIVHEYYSKKRYGKNRMGL